MPEKQNQRRSLVKITNPDAYSITISDKYARKYENCSVSELSDMIVMTVKNMKKYESNNISDRYRLFYYSKVNALSRLLIEKDPYSDNGLGYILVQTSDNSTYIIQKDCYDYTMRPIADTGAHIFQVIPDTRLITYAMLNKDSWHELGRTLFFTQNDAISRALKDKAPNHDAIFSALPRFTKVKLVWPEPKHDRYKKPEKVSAVTYEVYDDSSIYLKWAHPDADNLWDSQTTETVPFGNVYIKF